MPTLRAFSLSLLLAFVPGAVLADGENGIAAAEVFFDDLSLPEGDGAPLALGGAIGDIVGSAAEAVDIGSLDAGLHLLFVRVQDTNGDWTSPVAQTFVVPETFVGDGANGIVAAEAFIDTDPGAGSAIPLAVAPGSGVEAIVKSAAAQLALDGLAVGVHTLYVRVLDEAGEWSETVAQSLPIPHALDGLGEPNVIASAQFRVDGGALQGISAADGAFGELSESVSTTRVVGSGYHSALVHFQDSVGHWSDDDTPLLPNPILVNDSDWDGLMDTWEMDHFHNLDQDGGGNPDDDQRNNADELRLGSNPTIFDADPPLNNEPAVVSGRVTGNGQGIAGVEICLQQGESATCGIFTDVDGTYVLAMVKARASASHSRVPT